MRDLIKEIGIPILTFLIPFSCWMVDRWLKRHRPQRVVCREIDRFSMVATAKTTKSHIKVTYKDKLIENLAMLEVQFHNKGLKEIKDIEMLISLKNAFRILDVTVTETLLRSDGTSLTHRIIEPNELRISIPYLNSYQSQRHLVTAKIIIDGSSEGVKYAGGGLGWSVEAEKMPTPNVRLARALISMVLVLVLLVSKEPLSNYLRVQNGKPPINSADIYEVIVMVSSLIIMYGIIYLGMGSYMRRLIYKDLTDKTRVKLLFSKYKDY